MRYRDKISIEPGKRSGSNKAPKRRRPNNVYNRFAGFREFRQLKLGSLRSHFIWRWQTRAA